jgi:hypothetical protein
MSLEGIDSDTESWDERSDYVVARRYMDYEIRGNATAEELAWLHEHPIEWLRALRVAAQDVQNHLTRANADLYSDPRKPTPTATAEVQAAWSEIKIEADRIATARQTFLGKTRERMALVRTLLPQGRQDPARLDTIIVTLLSIEMNLRDAEVDRARHRLGRLILSLSARADEIRAEPGSTATT